MLRSFTGYRPGPRYGTDAEPFTDARIDEAPASTGPWTTIDTIALDPVDTDPTNPAERSFSTDQATLTAGWYRIVFLDADGDEDYTDPVMYPPAARLPFATADDIATRLGVDAYTGAELAQVALLADLATDLILDAIGNTRAWAETQASLPATLKTVAIEMIARVLTNPTGAASVSETLGAYAHSESWDAASVGLTVTRSERRLLRRSTGAALTSVTLCSPYTLTGTVAAT